MPYLTGDPIMVPLTLRPASYVLQSTHAVQSTSAPQSYANPADETAVGNHEDVPMGNEDRREEERSHRLQAKNRRKRYLEVHPDYFDDSSLELADPLLYDRLIRRFQTHAEREAEGRRKGFSGQMATDLWRAEAKKDALSQQNPDSLFVYKRGPNGEILEEDKDEVPMSKEEGKAWWVDEMTQRFLRGGDGDFDYRTVDGNDKYDDPEEERDLQDAWFESMESDFDSDGEGKGKMLTGETGIQDY